MKILNSIKSISLATIALSIVAGLLFIFFPAQCMKYIALILGIALITVGAYAIANYFVKNKSVLLLTLGIIVVICGAIVCLKYKAIVSFIMIVLGIFILASGIVDLITSIRAVFTFKITGCVTLLLSIATIVFGIIAITKSTQLSEGIIQFIGVALLIYAVLDIIAFVQVRKLVSNAKAVTNDVETDATIVEEIDE